MHDFINEQKRTALYVKTIIIFLLLLWVVCVCFTFYWYNNKPALPNNWNGIELPMISEHEYDYKSNNIVTLPLVGWTDNRVQEGEINGSFFLGTGSINGSISNNLVYTTMVKFPNGVIRVIELESVDIILSDEVEPNIKITDGAICYLAMSSFNCCEHHNNIPKNRIRKTVTVTVPNNSIQYSNSFNGK